MRNHKKSVLVLLAVLSVAMVTAMAALRGQTQNNSPSQNKSVYKDDPTPIQEGVMTEKQKQHSKHYQQYKGTGVKIRDLADKQINNQSKELTVVALPGLAELSPNGQSDATTAAHVLKDIARRANVIVTGTVKDKHSQLTENGMFIFTDYEMNIEEVLKDNLTVHIEPNSTITVTRPGGKILLNGQTYSALDRNAKPLQVGGQYLLFLQFIPSTGAYKSFSGRGGFQINDGKVIALSDNPLDSEFEKGKSAAAFISDIRLALVDSTQGQKEGTNE